ncbi:MAG: hypothetical protein ACTHOH_15095 [Lysobacteraceae bacterium]
MLKLAATIFISLLVSACGNRSPATAQEGASSPAATSPKAASTVSGSARHAAEPIVDVPKIAGKSLAEVSAILGEPTSCEMAKQGKKCLFNTGGTEVVFISGKSDWITVETLDNAPYSSDALPLLGFGKENPVFSSENVIRWSNIPGFEEISIFPSAAGVDYAHIKTATP